MKRFHVFLRKNRFELFLTTLIFNLFGSIIFDTDLFTKYLFPTVLLLNLVLGINLLDRTYFKISLIILFFVNAFVSGFSMLTVDNMETQLVRFSFYFLFYSIMGFEITRQIWFAKRVTKNVIFGVISGYITLGLVGFFIFMSVEITVPGSFKGLLLEGGTSSIPFMDSLLYYSYVTLLTIGYGDIVPVTAVAQKAAILIGLMGQFYLVIITSIVVGKFLNQATKKIKK